MANTVRLWARVHEQRLWGGAEKDEGLADMHDAMGAGSRLGLDVGIGCRAHNNGIGGHPTHRTDGLGLCKPDCGVTSGY